MSEPICCTRCFRWHEPPMCAHDSEANCRECGYPIGYKGDDAQPSDTCVWCWSSEPRIPLACETVPTPAMDDAFERWLAEVEGGCDTRNEPGINESGQGVAGNNPLGPDRHSLCGSE